jgi:DNA-binding transcriptional LysR family regulator
MFDESNAPTPDQLRALYATLETGSFSAAARRLGKTQSAVSQAVASLESQLGLELFDRSGYRPAPTDAGRTIGEQARRVLRELDALADLAKDMSLDLEPVLSIAVDELFPMDRLAWALRLLTQRPESARVIVRTGPAADVAQRVAEGLASVGVCGPLERDPPDLEREPLAEIGLVPVVAADHALAQHSAPVPLSLLREHVQIVLASQNPYTEGMWRGAVGSDVWSVGSLETKRELLFAGLGWGTMPRHMVEHELGEGSLVRFQPEGWAADDHLIKLDAIFPRRSRPGGMARWLLGGLGKDRQA